MVTNVLWELAASFLLKIEVAHVSKTLVIIGQPTQYRIHNRCVCLQGGIDLPLPSFRFFLHLNSNKIRGISMEYLRVFYKLLQPWSNLYFGLFNLDIIPVCLGGLVVTCLSVENWFLSVIKNFGTTSFTREVSVGAHVVHLWHVKQN
jgi:hypothetical protein